ncbi:phage late control D family protein [Roseibium sp.]|uniref:phage late control D family protein n=1 Tax=Roseibium sp. TaxID=1936156 RepID=UPI003B51ECCA
MWKVHWRVFVAGIDMTISMRPYLTDISITDKAGSASDTCSLTFDDTDGQIHMPPEGAPIRVLMNRIQVFKGVVDKVRSTGSRGGGRLLKVTGKGFDTRGKAKEPLQFHLDDGSIGDFLSMAANFAGYTMQVDPTFQAIKRVYQAADGESFVHLGQRLARELGATFKIQEPIAVLVKRGVDFGLPAILGTFGGEKSNVINWDIEPFSGRRGFTKAKAQWFDREKAEFKETEVDIQIPDRTLPDAVNLIRSRAADEGQARDLVEARKGEAEREGGSGTVLLDLYPGAQAEGLFTLRGTRAGIDGQYRIESVQHKADRKGGSVTSLSLKQPHGGAGKDSRPEGGGQPGTSVPSNAPSNGALPGTAGGDLEFIGAGEGDGPE